jgi:E3 ubiquitin-protein ligase HERC3
VLVRQRGWKAKQMMSSGTRLGFAGLAWLGLLGTSCGAGAPFSGDRDSGSEPVAEVSDELKLASGLSQPIAAGLSHACAILEGGALKCWGSIAIGVPGEHGGAPGSMGNALPSVSLGAGRTALAVTAGMLHTCALLDNGSVKCWGDNSNGQLGLGDTVPRRNGTPDEMGDNLPAVQLGLDRTAKAIAAGAAFTCALLDTNQIKCWGAVSQGELGRRSV